MTTGGPRLRLRGVLPGGQVLTRHARRAPVVAGPMRGQSLTEFALVIPFLLIILLTAADFGRYFAAAIRLESTARTAAEIAAQEYLRAAAPTDYAAVHGYAWQSVCDEADGLANVTYNGPATECAGVPTLVCVHDGIDDICDTRYNAASGVPAECTALADPISNAQTGGTETSRYVEVRVCYRFNTILSVQIPFIGGVLAPLAGDFYIQKVRTFTVADY